MNAAGIILAAGKSERMGEAKALLKLRDGSTFLARAIDTLDKAGIQRIVIVANPATRESFEQVCRDLGREERTTFAVNPRPEDGMISSIRIACASFGDPFPERAIVTLVDIPDTSPTVARKLLETELSEKIVLAIPRFEDGPGHPVMLLKGIREILDDLLPMGLKSVIEKYPDRIAEISCEGRQPWDVDTPRDYARIQS